MQTFSPAHSSFSASAAPSEFPRQLQDDVLQAAEEAVLVGAVSAGVAELPPLQAGLPTAGELLAQVKRHVAAQPCQSALLAAAAGALLMLVLRAKLRKLTGSKIWAQMR